MGLISLPYMNRVGSYMYWENLWHKTFNYKQYLYMSLFVNRFFYKLFDSLFFCSNYKFIYNYPFASMADYRIIFADMSIFYNQENVYFGRMWIMSFQNWYIIKINLVKQIYIDWKKTKKFFKFNKLRYYYYYMLLYDTIYYFDVLKKKGIKITKFDIFKSYKYYKTNINFKGYKYYKRKKREKRRRRNYWGWRGWRIR